MIYTCPYCKQLRQIPHQCQERDRVFDSYRAIWPKRFYTVLPAGSTIIKRVWRQ